jgi:oligopeptide transport system ATP-binding protein
MVFQDPYSSLDPKWSIAQLIAEPLAVHGIGTSQDRERRASELLELVGLDSKLVGERKPREVSGGQCQRVAIARALALNPEVLILDESVSSLDVSVQAQVINLLEDLRDEFDLSYLFIAHDLSVVKHVSDRVAVMYLGKFAELGPSDEVYARPHHPYTNALMGSIPGTPAAEALSPQSIEALGEMPSPLEPPSGCRFRTRCSQAEGLCAEEEPELRELEAGRFVACHFPINFGSTRRSAAKAEPDPANA